MSDLFNEEIISQATHTKWAGKTVHFARETDSTNLWGKRAWREEGAGHGELFVAEYQSAGRGRFTRRWSAPPDSAITMSILICPKFSPQKAPMLTLVMGLSVAQAVAEIGLDVGIKWPNDVVVSRKKICGILTEMTMKQDKIGCAVIGVGINVNMKSFPEEMADIGFFRSCEQATPVAAPNNTRSKNRTKNPCTFISILFIFPIQEHYLLILSHSHPRARWFLLLHTSR